MNAFEHLIGKNSNKKNNNKNKKIKKKHFLINI